MLDFLQRKALQETVHQFCILIYSSVTRPLIILAIYSVLKQHLKQDPERQVQLSEPLFLVLVSHMLRHVFL
jgi:hypothetical protein